MYDMKMFNSQLFLFASIIIQTLAKSNFYLGSPSKDFELSRVYRTRDYNVMY